MVQAHPLRRRRNGLGRAMQETFTHGRILYTLFDSFVNHILASHPPPRGFFRRSNVGPEGYFVAKLRESRGCRPKPVEPRFAPEFCWLL